MMKWEKQGLLFGPELLPDRPDWMLSHAQNPIQEHIGGDLFRIHYAARNKENKARGGFFVININEPKKILEYTKEPTLDFGDLGCFDDCGTMPSCIVDHDGKKYMYYTGWSQGRATPFTFFIGLMMSSDGGKTYTRYSKAPVLGRSFHDPYLTCSPFVIKENNKWRMWYVSGTGWDGTYQLALPGAPVKMKHFYHLKYAESKDGIHWDNNGQVAIDYRDKDEYAIARPILLKDQELYKMWFCYRGGTDTYRGGYAESKDGIEWSRKDQDIGLDVSATGWDSEMVCYPCVFKHKGKSYMLYNGNDYGRTGVGLAIGRDE